MTEKIQEAFEFVAKYGNVSSSVDDLVNIPPTSLQLRDCLGKCIENSGEINKSIQMISLVCKFHDLDFVTVIDLKKYKNWDDVRRKLG